MLAGAGDQNLIFWAKIWAKNFSGSFLEHFYIKNTGAALNSKFDDFWDTLVSVVLRVEYLRSLDLVS